MRTAELRLSPGSKYRYDAGATPLDVGVPPFRVRSEVQEHFAGRHVWRLDVQIRQVLFQPSGRGAVRLFRALLALEDAYRARSLGEFEQVIRLEPADSG